MFLVLRAGTHACTGILHATLNSFIGTPEGVLYLSHLYRKNRCVRNEH